MDLSSDNFQEKFNSPNRAREEFSSIQGCMDILDLSSVDLGNVESWLYEPKEKSDKNWHDWLYGSSDTFASSMLNSEFYAPKSSKSIDTRTFTRPKKKYSRPSLKQYEQQNEQIYETEMNLSSEDQQSSFRLPKTVREELEIASTLPNRPLHFDLSQPTSLHNFDSFLINSAEADSFQNMSPPSLVNSLCSSTFANLMENSYIKNDPVLREIRDKDFTETVMLQDTEAPMFQSISESCSSLNSDTPENFLRKMSFSGNNNGTFRRNVSEQNTTITENNITEVLGSDPNATFDIHSVKDSLENNKHTSCSNMDSNQSTKSSPHQPLAALNGTYRRTPKHNGTFRKSDLKNNRLSLNLTYEMPKESSKTLDKDLSRSTENDMNNSNKGSSEDMNSTRTQSSTRTVILHSDSIENLKKQFSSSDTNMDLNRLSYCIEEKADLNATYKEEKASNELNRTVEIKRLSLGSADSLDRMSSLSSSSKGSNKVLSMEDVEAIVEMQERSLSQVMSTPKPHVKQKLWENNFLSPIVASAKEHLSDSELSDGYKSVKSHVSSKASLDSWKNPPIKSLGHLAANNDIKLKTNQRTSYTITGPRPLQALPNSVRGSYNNINSLKATSSNIGGSTSNLYKPPSNIVRPPSAGTNLKTMGTKLKGSYTSLKPISANLPVVPPVGTTLNSTHTISRTSSAANVTRNLDSAKTVVPSGTGDSTFVKPQIPRSSGLPRPTGIPRPSSRIPGPRTSNIRPTSSRNINY